MSYTGINDEQTKAILSELNVRSINDLFANIPAEVHLKKLLNLPSAMDDITLQTHLRQLASSNHGTDTLISFMGAGSYDHYIPPVVDALANRSEFVTAYTPYQAEASQGALQVFYEYQTMICELTGMDVANASMYEAGSAIAEAVLMAKDITHRNKIIISRNIHPEYVQIIKTYTDALGVEIEMIPAPEGAVDPAALANMVDDQTASVVVAHPNFFGCLNPLDKIAEVMHNRGGLLITAVNPIALGLLTPPGKFGVDIVVGEGQPLGIPQNFGGPYLGCMAA